MSVEDGILEVLINSYIDTLVMRIAVGYKSLLFAIPRSAGVLLCRGGGEPRELEMLYIAGRSLR